MDYKKRESVFLVSTYLRENNKLIDVDGLKLTEGIYRTLEQAKEKVETWIKNGDECGYDATIEEFDIDTGERVDIIYLKHFWNDEVRYVDAKSVGY